MQQNRRKWLMKIGVAIAGMSLAKVNSFASPGRSFVNTATDSKQFYEALWFVVFPLGWSSRAAAVV